LYLPGGVVSGTKRLIGFVVVSFAPRSKGKSSVISPHASGSSTLLINSYLVLVIFVIRKVVLTIYLGLVCNNSLPAGLTSKPQRSPVAYAAAERKNTMAKDPFLIL